ncbi:unnamed protein product, partial [Diabrotica balteata]
MDKYVLVEYLSSIKTAICETFKHTQRIKLTSFDVSNHYIILGTNSGGIYIFKRTPCEFLRLIPSKEGSTVHIKISPDEKNLAVASARGLVIILENFFADLNVRPLLFTEHDGNAITVMKWHGNSVYSGDNNGKIAVCTVHAKLTKAIFQTPSSSLMSLDSSIVQIDTYKNYLLISTKTRTYLCDTEKEQYKQIGKKLRDGNFGACFSQTDFSDHFDRCEGVRRAFKTIESEDIFSSKVSNDVKIYCARPGARLWTANFEATVLSTYQFRNSLSMQSSDLITIENAKDTRLRVTKFEEIEISKDFNFSKVYLLYKNIIMTYDNKGIYFFNVEKSNIVCWSHAFDNIRDVKIMKPHIYVWRNDLQINIISLQSLEEIVINTLISKQYLLCSDLCVQFNEEVFALIEKSKKINLISILRTKLKELGEDDLFGKIENILDKLDEYYKDQTVGLKLENGIVLVENQYSAQATTLPENLESNFQNLDTEKDLKILYKQYVLNKTHKLAELTESSKILTNTNLDELPSLFESFIKYVKDKSEEDATLWCKEQLLKFVSKSLYNFDELKPPTVESLSKYFLDLNDYKIDCCKCGFPLPRAHKRKLDHYNLACKLFNYTENKQEYLNNIPLLYKLKACDLALNLGMITQFSDKEVFKKVLFKMTYDKWDDIIKLYIKLSQGHCLNCSETICIDGLLTWTELGMLMVESIGPKNANRLVMRYAQYIPKGQLKQEFYQSCMFSMTCPNQGVAVKFVEEVCAAGSSKMLGDCLEQFLQKQHSGLQSPHKSIRPDSNIKCSYCQISVSNPILREVKHCVCGHYYHQICFKSHSNICKYCVEDTNS